MQLNLSKFHPLSEKIVDIVCTKVQNSDKAFFRIEVAYYMAKLASNMHTSVRDITGNVMPVNLFAFAYGESGYGKGFSQNIIEGYLTNGFEETFTEVIYPETAKQSIMEKARAISQRTGIDEITVEADLTADFASMGDFMYGFPEGTAPALKQLRTAITFAGVGAASLEMDEIGYNITKNVDVMATLLEMFDTGKTKDKLIKSTKDQKRINSLRGATPANVFAFGTPVTAFDGGYTEETLIKLKKSGYGRRSFFAYGDMSSKYVSDISEDELFAKLTDKSLTSDMDDIHDQLTALASMDLVDQELLMDAKASRFALSYNQFCKQRASAISEYRPIERAEMLHRVAKVTKLAGAYAFIDKADAVTTEHLEYAIALAEVSGQSLSKILNQPKAHVRLAQFLCEFGSPVTQADLVEHLPFYTGSASQKKDLMTLAMAHGHRNAMAIKSFEESGVAMWQGETLEPTNNEALIVSTSTALADNYTNKTASIKRLSEVCSTQDMNFCNHHFKNGEVGKGNRSKANTEAGTNIVVFDVDNTRFKPHILHALLEPYNHVIYETKSSTPEEPRYRLILVLSHIVKLDDVEYKKFCNNIAKWLPINVDLPAIQREKKYRTYEGSNAWYQDTGANLNVMPYYPNTREAEENLKHNSALLQARIKGMHKWVIHTASKGNRNNTLFAYVKFLSEHTTETKEKIIERVRETNSHLVDPVDEAELTQTIFKSLKDKA